jgi:hypothetical protein
LLMTQGFRRVIEAGAWFILGFLSHMLLYYHHHPNH